MKSYWYRAFGLCIESELPLPIPQSEAGSADVKIRLCKVGIEQPDEPQYTSLFRATPQEVCVLLDATCKVLVRNGNEILVESLPGVDQDVVATWVQSAGISLLLHQRGFLVLHASAVAIGGGAVCFVGEVGWGKSTTAAALAARGNQLLCDDLVAIRIGAESSAFIMPGIPHLKLTPQSLEFLGESGSALQPVAGDGEKRVRPSGKPLGSSPIPLKSIFILGEGDSVRIEHLPPQLAMVELMKHAFVARRTDFLKKTATAESHFKACATVVNSASVCRLCRPKRFDLLPAVLDLVEAHSLGTSRARAIA